MSLATRFAVTLLAVTLMSALLPNALIAQGKGNASPAAQANPLVVVVIQAATLPEPGGRAVVVRRQIGSPREVIVLPAGATAADLAAAMSVLTQARERDKGSLPAPQVRISISSADFAGDQSPEVVRFFENTITRLARSSVIEVPGVASGPALILPLNRSAN